jgi:hypothetical protein
MSLGTLSVCLTILLMNMYHHCPEAPPPSCIRAYLQRKLKNRDGDSDLYQIGTITKENNGKKYHLHNSIKYSSPSGTLTKHRRHCHDQESTDLTVFGKRDNEYEHDGVCQTILNGGERLKPPPKVKVLRFANQEESEAEISTKEPTVEIDKTMQVKQEWQEFVRLLDKIFFSCVTLTMLLTSFFLLFMPWLKSSA